MNVRERASFCFPPPPFRENWGFSGSRNVNFALASPSNTALSLYSMSSVYVAINGKFYTFDQS